MKMVHEEEDYCINESRISKLEIRVAEQHDDISHLELSDEKIKEKHHKDFVSFRNSMNELQGELIGINSSIRTLIVVVTIIGTIVSIFEVLMRFPPFH